MHKWMMELPSHRACVCVCCPCVHIDSFVSVVLVNKLLHDLLQYEMHTRRVHYCASNVTNRIESKWSEHTHKFTHVTDSKLWEQRVHVYDICWPSCFLMHDTDNAQYCSLHSHRLSFFAFNSTHTVCYLFSFLLIFAFTWEFNEIIYLKSLVREWKRSCI